MLGAGGAVIANRYRLRGLLGTGAYGEVWEALDLHRNHVIALKLLGHKDKAEAWREASVLTALESPYILKVNNADVVVDVPYLDTVLADCSLDKLCTPYGAEPRRAVDWTRRALRGLDLCHRRGLLHRDVKPANIFFVRPDDIRLGDFGVAALMAGDGTADPHGDYYIRAPEFYSAGRATIASDVYSMAITLYNLVAGRNPFAHIKTHAELEAAITSGTYEDLRDAAPHVSVGLAAKVRRGMDLDPAKRYATAAEFDGELVLPTRDRQFEPIPPHTAHLRCWAVTGKGADACVCVVDDAGGRFVVETWRVGSGSKIRKHCFEARAAAVSRELRKVFNDLR